MRLAAAAILLLTSAVLPPAVAQTAAPTPAMASKPTPGAPPPATLPQATLPQGEIRLSGSNTIGSQLAPDLLAAYGRKVGLTAIKVLETTDPDEHVLVMEAAETARTLRGTVSAHGTATAFPALLHGTADIGMASRPVNADERKTLMDAQVGDPAAPGNAHVISLDGVVVIVHKDNPIHTMTLEQIKGLFTGATTNWSTIGGRNVPVTIYARDSKSGTFDTFRSLALSGAAIAPQAKLFESSDDLADAVASDPGGIGFVGFAYARNALPVSLNLGCGLETAPLPFLVRTEEYPLSRRLFFYTPTKTPPLVQDFIKFSLDDAAQPIVEHAGFINLSPELAGPDDLPIRIRTLGAGLSPAERTADEPQIKAFTQAVDGARRLSITFRFNFDDASLDARALRDFDRLVAWAKASANQHYKITLIGHASNQGTAAYNAGLSLRRASEVAKQLAAAGIKPATVVGVGTASPVGCTDEQTKGGVNRRVEVWVQ